MLHEMRTFQHHWQVKPCFLLRLKNRITQTCCESQVQDWKAYLKPNSHKCTESIQRNCLYSINIVTTIQLQLQRTLQSHMFVRMTSAKSTHKEYQWHVQQMYVARRLCRLAWQKFRTAKSQQTKNVYHELVPQMQKNALFAFNVAMMAGRITVALKQGFLLVPLWWLSHQV